LGTAPSYRTLPRACDLDAELLLAWPTADMSFMDPETGVNVVHGAALGALDPSELATRRKELLEQWECDTLPYGAAARHLVHEVIAPRRTRDVIIQFLDTWESRGTIGPHHLANWRTKF